MTNEKTVLIIGAGPAGLTAAYELLAHEGFRPIVFEKSRDIGGISKTVRYAGNRIDIGGHRFFSKSDWVMQWWQNVMPLQGQPARDDKLLQRDVPLSSETDAPDPETSDRVMLVRNRLSRILFLRTFFDYPVSLSMNTVKGLGLWRMLKIGVGYMRARLFPIKPEKSLEDFFINRFGKELYGTFFKDYTEKVWGVPCDRIEAAWGAQRIKGLSITKAILHALKQGGKKGDINQKGVETSLIEQFMYPKLGPGQLWEYVADDIQTRGGEIRFESEIVAIHHDGETITGVTVRQKDGSETQIAGDYVISTMPVKELIAAMGERVPDTVREVGGGLLYRDFMTVGLLLDKLAIRNATEIPTVNDIVPDNWIYIQEPDVDVGRLQIFNNWSPYLVGDPEKVWVGMEYFCNEGDRLWGMDDETMKAYGIAELEKIGVIRSEDVYDSVVLRVPKAYPAYFGTYDRFETVKTYVDGFENLFLIGRNGMHRYNNMDHSMLSAKQSVENIVNGINDKDNIWNVNAEKEYHETK